MLDIAIIIRTKNESRWIGFCLSSIARQKFSNYEILIVDNCSNDSTVEICKSFNCKIVKYSSINSNYKPGEALNIGIKSIEAKAYVFLSAHCIPKTNNWLSELWDDLFSADDFAAVYGRQIPMAYSSDQVKRDLALIFSTDSRIQTKDPFFHNANSIIKSEWLKPDLFNTHLSNIEDREWAAKTITKKGKIFYSARSEVFHYHGLNHSDNSRLSKTTRIIEEISQSYNDDFNDQLSFGFDYFLSIRHKKEKDFYKFQLKQIKYTLLNLVNNDSFKKDRDRIIISAPRDIYSSIQEIISNFSSKINIDIIQKELWLSQKWVSIIDVIIDSFNNEDLFIKESNRYICYLDHSYLLRDYRQLNDAVDYLLKNEDVSSIIFHDIPPSPLVSLDKASSNNISEQLLAPIKVREKVNLNEVQILTGYGTFFNKNLITSGEIIGKKTHHISIPEPCAGITVRNYDTLNLILKLKNIDF
tara:strand:+ start:1951 stop:3363 length:1413 start_codon:yes stop_codon:yes gene_type:complete